ncbi:MAG: TonB-dependent receptor plug domain-containing protein [Steroidobacteraceae bacterium]
MLAYEYDRQAGLDASQRSYIPDLGGPFTILPASWRNSFILSGSQDLGDDSTIAGSALYGTKNYHARFTIVPAPAQFFLEDTRGQSTMSSTNLTLLHSMASGWTVSLTGSYSRMRQNLAALETFGPFGAETGLEGYNTSLGGADILANGTVFRPPGGEAKIALGASFENQTFSESLAAIGFAPSPEQGQSYGRQQESAYGELLVPVIGTPNALPWARKLEISVAGRYDHYSDFGSTVNPKTGVVWSPYTGLDLRASYGRSYRAPLLNELDSPVTYETQAFPDPTSSTGVTDTLYINGGNRALQPEKSKSFSVGFDLREGALAASSSYFHIAYQDRIGTPPIANFLTILSDPVDAPYVTRDPSAAFVDAAFNSPGFQTDWVGLGPSGVMAVFNNQYTNLVTSTVSGVDANVSYQFKTTAGSFTPTVAVERQIQNDEQPSPTSAPIQILDLYGEPLKWKVRGGLGWARGPYGASLNLNFANGYRDEFTVPSSRIASWTTIDAHLSYRVPEAARFAAVRGLSVAITIDNLADRKPPNVAIPQTVADGEATLPYDPANASPIGRFISVQFNKRWSW